MATSADGGGTGGGVWLIRCTGVEGTGGTVEPEGRYLAGFGPDVVDPAGGMAGPVQLVPHRG